MKTRVPSTLRETSKNVRQFSPRVFALWPLGVAGLFAAICMFAVSSSAQTEGPPAGGPRSADADGNPGGWRGNFNREDMQARMLSNLRSQFDVADDAEWKLISERITKVMELRRTVAGGGFGLLMFRGGNQGNRPATTVNPEADALRGALEDKLPDAEIKARLERLRLARKQSEARLDQAREDLRAVLTVRQEAVAVLVGLLQ